MITGNLLFNTGRAANKDEGSFNSWDRAPYITTLRNGTASTIPAWNYINNNFCEDDAHCLSFAATGGGPLLISRDHSCSAWTGDRGLGVGWGGLTTSRSVRFRIDAPFLFAVLANYGPSLAIDNDDGSSYYQHHENVVAYGEAGFKADFGAHDMRAVGNFYAYVTARTESLSCQCRDGIPTVWWRVK